MGEKSKRLRKLLTNKDELLVMVVVGTAHEAQLAEKVGFKALGISGSNTSAQILGLPDAGLITMTELVENTERICRAVDLPVRVDCDTGFGNAINVRRTVESMIRAGAACLFLEDQVAPKRCGFVKGKQVISLEEAAGKYRAAVDVRNEMDPDFIIMARCDAMGAVGGSLDEVIRRGKAYLAAGADIFYPEALRSRDEIKQVRDALKDSLLFVNPGAIKPTLTEQEYKELGLCMAVSHISKVGSVAMYDYLVELKTKGIRVHGEFMERTKSHPLGGHGNHDLTGFPKVVEWEKKYLPPEQLDKYDSSTGLYDPRVGHKS
jgi:2-methylisocitrate lyase-like PEP mutase family enzyme